MKENILKLREEGKSYSQIQSLLHCSKATISYYCGVGQKEKNTNRLKKRRASNKLITKIESFQTRTQKSLKQGIRKFQKRTKDFKVDKNLPTTFTISDVLKKFGQTTNCYLSGEKIDIINDNNYHFDHIVPVSRGGSNTLDNLGILFNVVNKMKSNLNVEEFLQWNKKILENNGYEVRLKDK